MDTEKHDELKIKMDENHLKFVEILNSCQELRRRKLDDYGFTFNEFGYVGLLVKLGDKYGRIKRLYEKSKEGKSENFENVRDSLVDLINYSTMAIMELDSDNERRSKK